METAQTAIVRWHESTEPSNMRPFQAFLWHLSQQDATIRNDRLFSDGSQWISGPYERMIAEGLWPVLMHAAKKINLSFGTQRQIEIVIEHFSPWLDVALIAAHETPEQAAIAFRKTVLHTVHSRLVSAAVAPVATSEIWISPIAGFLANALKAATALADEIDHLLSRLQIDNDLRDMSSGKNVESDARYLVRQLRLSPDPKLFLTPNWYVRLGTIRAELQDELRWKSIVRRLPFRLSGVPERLRGEYDAWSVNKWLATHILLDVLDTPGSRGYLEAPEFKPSLERLSDTPGEQVIAGFFRRMACREFYPSDAERNMLASHLSGLLANMRLWSTKLDFQTAMVVFIDIRPEHADPGVAMLIASDLDESKKQARRKGGEKLSQEERYGHGPEVIAAARFIAWESMSLDQLEEQIVLHGLSCRGAVQYLHRIPAEEREACYERVMQGLAERDLMDGETIAALFRVPGIRLDLRFITKYVEVIPVEQLEHYLYELFNRLDSFEKRDVDLEGQDPEDVFFAWCEVACRCGQTACVRWLNTRGHRRSLVSRLFGLSLRSLSDKKRKRLRGLCTLLDGEVLDRLMLGFAHQDRAGMASDHERLKRESDTTQMPAWGAYQGPGSEESPFTDILEVVPLDLARLEHHAWKWTEYGVFRWLHAGEPDVLAQWHAFQEDLKRWRYRFVPQPVTRSPSRKIPDTQAIRKRRSSRRP